MRLYERNTKEHRLKNSRFITPESTELESVMSQNDFKVELLICKSCLNMRVFSSVDLTADLQYVSSKSDLQSKNFLKHKKIL